MTNGVSLQTEFFFLSLLRQHAVRSVRRDRCISEQVYTFSWSYFIITEKKQNKEGQMPHIAPVEMFVISLLISLGILRISLNTCGFFSPYCQRDLMNCLSWSNGLFVG